MPQIDQLADGGALRADDDIPIERSAGTRKAHGYPMDPPTVSDTGTDTYAGNFGRDVNDGELIVGDFGSSNTTTTPTLENTGGTPAGAKTMTTRDGSALWAGAVSGPHELQYASGTDTYLVLEPNPSVQRDFTRAASATQKGDVELATSAETDTGTDTTRAVTPKGAADTYPKGEVAQIAQAWVAFDGTGTVAIKSQYNVSSITDNGTGDYTVNFTNAMSDANYAVHLTAGLGFGETHRLQDISASDVRVQVSDFDGTLEDCDHISVTVFG